MRQRDNDRARAEGPADALLQRPGTAKARNRHLADEDDDPRLEQLELSVEPVRAILDCGRRRPEVASAGAVAPGKAAHQSRDVGEVAELFGAREAGAQHPAVELLAGAT